MKAKLNKAADNLALRLEEFDSGVDGEAGASTVSSAEWQETRRWFREGRHELDHLRKEHLHMQALIEVMRHRLRRVYGDSFDPEALLLPSPLPSAGLASSNHQQPAPPTIRPVIVWLGCDQHSLRYLRSPSFLPPSPFPSPSPLVLYLSSSCCLLVECVAVFA